MIAAELSPDGCSIAYDAAAKALRSLEILAYLKRKVGKKDKRCKRIKLTDQARLIEQRFLEVLEGFEAIATKNLTATEIELLAKLMKQMSRNVVSEPQKIA